jgi:Prokaryotic Cytochrome C oxidase subunit IV
MKDRLASPFIVWLLLVSATAAAYLTQLEAAHGFPRVAGSIVLILAFAKVWLIGMRYMELKHAPFAFRLVYQGWTIALGSALVILFAQV